MQNKMKILCIDKPWETVIFQRRRDELFTRGRVSCCWIPKRDDRKKAKLACQVASPWKTGHLPERIDWVLYWRVIELVLSPKDVWCHRKYEWCLGRINAREESRKGKRKGKRNGKRKGKYNFLYGFDFTWVVNKKDFHQNRDLKINKLHIRVKVHVAMTFLLNLWYLRK